jgi:hypothetical protein
MSLRSGFDIPHSSFLPIGFVVLASSSFIASRLRAANAGAAE